MSFFHVRTLPGYQWPPLADSAIAQVWVAYLHLEHTQWLDPAEIQRRQLEQVRSLLAHCIVNVPYYRDVLPKAGIVPGALQTLDDFRRIPLLARSTYQEKITTFASVVLPAGTVATGVRHTAGSSGLKVPVLQTNLANLWWCAFYLRDLEWSGIDPTGTLASIRASGQEGAALQQGLQGRSLPCWLALLDPLIVSGASHVMDIQQDPRRQLQWLRRIAPDYLSSTPSNLEALANLVRLQGPLPGLKAVQAIQDTLTPETQTFLVSSFGVPVKSIYSCAETGYLASPCPEGHGLHVHAENVLLEVLDEQGRPCPPGETGWVYVTDLRNFRGPLIRYALGDEATLGTPTCPCGRGLPLLARVQGKREPLFLLPDGRRKSSSLLGCMLRQGAGHWQHQVVQQSAHHVVVRLAIHADWTEQRAGEVQRQIQEFFEAPMRVDIEVHDRLPFPVQGKWQSMIPLLEPSAGKGA